MGIQPDVLYYQTHIHRHKIMYIYLSILLVAFCPLTFYTFIHAQHNHTNAISSESLPHTLHSTIEQEKGMEQNSKKKKSRKIFLLSTVVVTMNIM